MKQLMLAKTTESTSTTMSFPAEEPVCDLQLSLSVGDSVDKPPTHYGADREESKEISEFQSPETLYLSRTKLQKVSEHLLRNSTLKYLYLEGNEVNSIPPCLFTSLPNLLWLDLRHNQIQSLPPEIGRHRALRTLLLEGNPITDLPPELGNVLSLTGLNLRDCPISYPPRDVLQRGVLGILQFLRGALAQRPVSATKSLPDRTAGPKNSSFLPWYHFAGVTPVPLETAYATRLTASSPAQGVPVVERLQLELMGSSLEEEEEDAVTEEEELQRFRELKHQMSLMEKAELEKAELETAASRDNRPKPRSLPTIKRKKATTKAGVTPQLHSFDTRIWNSPEERRQATLRELREKQDILDQRRKSQEALRKWWTQAKNTQSGHKQKRAGHQRQEEAETDTRPGAEDSRDIAQRQTYSTIECEESSAVRKLRQQIYAVVQKMEERRRNPTGNREEQIEAAERDVKEIRSLQAQLLDMERGRGFVLYSGHTRQEFTDK